MENSQECAGMVKNSGEWLGVGEYSWRLWWTAEDGENDVL